MGNILRMKHVSGGVTVWHRGYDYAQDGNRLQATSLPGDDVDDPQTYSESYTHDAHGSMTAMPSIPGGLTWDPQDRLIETDLSGGGVVYYVYDSAGMRVRKVWVNQSGTTSKERYYLGAWETYRETTDLLGSGHQEVEYAGLLTKGLYLKNQGAPSATINDAFGRGGQAFPEGRTVVYYRSTDLTWVPSEGIKDLKSFKRDTWVHEIGHPILDAFGLEDFVAGTPYWSDPYTKSGQAGAEAPSTPHGADNASEDLAISVSQHLTGSGILKTGLPAGSAPPTGSIGNPAPQRDALVPKVLQFMLNSLRERDTLLLFGINPMTLKHAGVKH